MPLTPRHDLPYPTLASTADVPSDIEDLAAASEAALNIGSPVGSMVMFAGPTAPSGWLKCEGQQVSRLTYADLFSVIGITYGSGDGSTTFNLPNLSSRVPRGGGTLGQTGGSETHTLAIGNTPLHTHSINHNHGSFPTASAGAHTHQVQDGAGTAAEDWSLSWEARDSGSVQNTGSGGTHQHTIDLPNYAGTSGSAGSSSPTPVTHLDPFLRVNFIIRTS